jgi:hypothetical protein
MIATDCLLSAVLNHPSNLRNEPGVVLFTSGSELQLQSNPRVGRADVAVREILVSCNYTEWLWLEEPRQG